jgi:23S rRNA (cytidine1920-2'-O)/16S rRNA (cytidine1409-2'-O)-methyltransferase
MTAAGGASVPADPRSRLRGRRRLDLVLVERGLVPSREQARALVLGGRVRVAGLRVDKAGAAVDPAAAIAVEGGLPYVGRGGLKLAGALERFGLEVRGLVAVDVGASTGGFTDCLLQRGAARVYAVDVGYGQLAWKLQSDARVVRLDRVNIRTAAPGLLPEACDLAVIDVSFISLRLVLGPALSLLRDGGRAVALVKPQFEVGRGRVGKGGVVRDPALWREALAGLVDHAAAAGHAVLGWCESPIAGADGNREFFLHLGKGGAGDRSAEIRRAVDAWRPDGA